MNTRVEAKCCAPLEVVSALRDEDSELARLASALGHPARIAILRVLQQRGTCICGDLVGVLPLAQSTVSQHLKTLKDAGWITGETDGPRTCYCLNPDAMDKFASLWADSFSGALDAATAGGNS